MGRVNLPQSYFHCPELSKREKAYLIAKAQESAKALVEGARSSNGPIRWTEAGTQNGAQMYKGEARNPGVTSGEDVNYMCGATTLHATLEECAEFFDLSTTAKMKDFVATQDDVHDGVVLYTLAEPTPQNNYMHQITVKWLLTNLMNPIKDRDFLTLECQDVFTDTTGRRGWVRSYHSIKLPCCPDMNKDLGFIRGSFYHSGYVFVESERPGWLDCIYSLQINLKGNLKLPQALYFAMMKRRIGTVGWLGQVIHERRLGKQKFLSDLELVPKNQRSRCQICAVSFGVLTRKTRCRKCGEVVCHQCTQIWDINVPKFGPKKVRVCTKCCSQTTKEAIEMSHAPSSSNSDRQSVSMASEQQSINESSPYDAYGRRRPSYENMPAQYGAPVPAPPRSYTSSEPEYGLPVPSPYAPGVYESPHSGPIPVHAAYPHQDPYYPPQPPHRGYYNPAVEAPTYPGYDDRAARQYGYDAPHRAPSPQPKHVMHHPQYHHHSSSAQDKLRRTGLTEETASMSSDFSNSHGYEDRGLTPTVLEQHARQAGRPGPVTQHQSMHLPRGPQRPVPPPQQQYQPYQRGSGAPYARPPVGYQQEYLQPNHQRRMSYGSDHNADVYREFHGYGAQPRGVQGRPGPGPSHDARSKASGSGHSREGDSSDSDDSQLDREIARPGRAVGGAAHKSQMLPSQNQTQHQMAPAPPPKEQQFQPTRSHMGLSFGSDQYESLNEEDAAGDHRADVFDEESLYSPVSKAIADDFSTLLRVEDDRGTMDSYRFSVTSSLMEPTISFCDTINDYSSRDTRVQLLAEEEELTTPPRKQSQGSADSSGPTASSRTSQSSGSQRDSPPGSASSSSSAFAKADAKKISVVQLYQKILELTKQQHALDTAPHAEAKDKDRVATELRQLYQRLNELTMNPEIEF